MTEKINFYYTETGSYAPKEGLPFVRRNNIAAIIKYKSAYLFLSWNEVNYENSLVTGGIDEEEEHEKALIREIEEETGYFDIKKITPVDAVNVSRFYVEHKNQNREAVYYPYLVELNSLEKRNVDEFEMKEHTCIWVETDHLGEVHLFDNHQRMLECALEMVEKENKNKKCKVKEAI